MADVLTFEEHRGPITGPDGRLVGRRATTCSPPGSRPPRASTSRCNVATPPRTRAAGRPAGLGAGARAPSVDAHAATPSRPSTGADCVVTDCWVSMGDEDEGHRHNLLAPYQVNARLMAAADARRDLHALPAGPSRRGGDGRGDRRAAVGRVRRGREPPARPEGHPGLVPRARTAPCRRRMSADAGSKALDDVVLPFAVEALDVRGRVGPARRRRSTRSSARHGYPDAGRAPGRRGGGADRAARLVAEVRGPLPAADPDRRRRSTCWWSISTRPTGCAPMRASTPTRVAALGAPTRARASCSARASSP